MNTVSPLFDWCRMTGKPYLIRLGKGCRRFGNNPIELNEFNGFGTTPGESHLPRRGRLSGNVARLHCQNVHGPHLGARGQKQN